MKFQSTFSILLEYALPGFFQPRTFSPCPEALPAVLGAGECEQSQTKGGRITYIWNIKEVDPLTLSIGFTGSDVPPSPNTFL